MAESGGKFGIPKPERFVWPPRRQGAGEAVPAEAPVADESGGASTAMLMPDPAVPPAVVLPAEAKKPVIAPAARTAVPSSAVAPGHLTGLRRVIDDLEVVWLGRVTPPLSRRIEEEGWAPDEPEAYCGRCGRTSGPHDADATGCSLCRGKKLPWERMVRLGEFEGLLRDVVHEVKYTRWRRLGEDVGRLLGRALAAEMEREGLDPARTVLVPVPTSFWRRIQRGIDHPLVIARGVSAATGLRISEALYRLHRPTQQSLPASSRAANVAGAIRARRWARLEGVNVVLVDDVTTTRATLAAAARAVRMGMKAGAGASGGAGNGGKLGGGGNQGRIWAAVAAVTPEPGRK